MPDESDTKWHLDRKVPIALLIARGRRLHDVKDAR